MEILFAVWIFAISCLALSTCQEATVSPGRACFEQALAANSSLNDCNTMFFTILGSLQVTLVVQLAGCLYHIKY